MIGNRRNASVITKVKKEYLVFLAGMLLILLVLSRYIVNGEPVDVRSEITEEAIMLTDGMEIVQPLTIPEGVNWRQGYYALFFMQCDPGSDGQLVCTLRQGEVQNTLQISLKEIMAGEWLSLEKLDFGSLKSGEATLSVHTEDVEAGELEVAVGQDYYGFGNFLVNGSGQQVTLGQAYHYHITGTEYQIRVLCYGIAVLCAVVLATLVYSACMQGSRRASVPAAMDGIPNVGADGHRQTGNAENTRTEAPKYGLAAFSVLTVMFMAAIYVVDSSIYLEPTYAEAVTNFLHYAREEKFAANLLITDAGYLPLLPRLITLFYLKLLRIPSAYVLYFMQATACLLCSMVWAFFVLYPFHGMMRFSNRILWCILVMLTCFCEETLFFTNLAYWGIYLLLLLLAAELEEFPGWIYVGLLGISALVCLSKGTYAVMFPLMILYLVFFRRSIGKRNKFYACVVGGASLLQLLYAFSGQGGGDTWVDTAAMGQMGYWLRLLGRTFTEFGAYLLLPLGEAVQHMPWLVIMVSLSAIAFLAVGFVRTIVLPGIRGQVIVRQRVAFYTIVMFQIIVDAFFLVTVKQVPDSWSTLGRISYTQMGDKYEIFSDMGFYMLLLTGSALAAERRRNRQNDEKDRNITDPASAESRGVKRIVRENPGKVDHGTGSMTGRNAQGGLADLACGLCGRYGILILIFLFCLTNPVMRLNGWKHAEVSDGRVYAGNINASWWEYKWMISESSFFIPVRGDNWAYSRNCNLYQVGAEGYFEETSGINLEEKISGYHSTYEVQDETLMQNLIEVMIERPMRVDGAAYQVRLLDDDGNLVAVAEQVDSGRNKKCIFRLEKPANGVKTIELTDGVGNPVYYKDYIAWVCAW